MLKSINKSLGLSRLSLLLRKDFGKLSSFSIIFGLVKLSGFISALWLSNLVEDIAHYGFFEYALGLGIFISIPFNTGMQGAYPYFNIKLEQPGFKSVFYLHPILMTAAVGLLIGVERLFFQVVPSSIYLALLIGAILAMQMLFSYILKSHEIIIKAVLLDGGMLLMVNFYNLYVYLSGTAYNFSILTGVLIFYFLALLSFFIVKFIQTKSDFSVQRYGQALGFGKHLVLSSVIIICFTNCARVFVEYFLGLEQVAYYSFYFRFSMMVIMIQQVLMIVFFKKIYQSDPHQLDYYFSRLIPTVLVIALFLWWCIPLLTFNLFSLFESSFSTYNGLYYILSFHCVFWISLAFNENIIYRESLSSKMNKAFALILLLMVGLFVLMYQMGYLDLFSLAIVNLLCLFLATDAQFYLLKKHKGICFKNNRQINRLVLVFFLVSYSLIFLL